MFLYGVSSGEQDRFSDMRCNPMRRWGRNVRRVCFPKGDAPHSFRAESARIKSGMVPVVLEETAAAGK